MLQPKLLASTPTSASAKEDVRRLIQSILEAVRDLANSRLAKWAAIANIVAVPIAVLTLIEGLPLSTQPAPKPPIWHSLEITQPSEGAHVGPIVDVHGTAPLNGKKRHYYLIVTPPQGSAQIQADPMEPSPDGVLYGRAVLGTGSVGGAKTFTIQILATTTAPKSLLQVPLDSERSKPISVIRQY